MRERESFHTRVEWATKGMNIKTQNNLSIEKNNNQQLGSSGLLSDNK